MKKFNYLIGLIISAVFVYLFIRNINPRELGQALKTANYWYLLPLVVANISTILFRAIRWQYLISSLKRIRIMSLFSATSIGFMANNILPARIGEFVRAYVIGKKENISKSSSFATIVVERLFDGFMVILLFALVLLFFPFGGDGSTGLSAGVIKIGGYLSIAFYALVLLILIFLKVKTHWINPVITKILSPFPPWISQKVTKILHSFSEGLAVLSNWTEIFWIFIYSIIIWGIYTLTVFFLFPAFNIQLSLVSAFFIQILLSLGVTLPSAPGFIGTFHLACALGLMYLGIPSHYAQSYSIVLWLISFIPVTILGFFFLWKEGLSLKKIRTENPEDF